MLVFKVLGEIGVLSKKDAYLTLSAFVPNKYVYDHFELIFSCVLHVSPSVLSFYR